jgi:hypothetical protein
MLAVMAYGKIAAYQATVGTSLTLTLPLAWVLLKLGFAPPIVGVAFIITGTICSFGRVHWAKHLLHMSVWRWMTDVVFPCSIIAIFAAPAAIAPRTFMPPSFIRLVISTMVSVTVIGMLGWFIVLNLHERLFLTQNTSKVVRKFIGWGQESVQRLVNTS